MYSWKKGAWIGFVFGIFLTILSIYLLLINNDKYVTFIGFPIIILTIIMGMVSFFSGQSNHLFFAIIGSIIGGIINILIYTCIGAIIGFIYGKIKSK